ncbi:hypothetical protein K2173_004628 [Erythroxylum novogranatense]|uniref:C2 domain-containing protein n=1 Tax=Erythroxylum novogranatense TaxID=1862640 RepID=A0AAV8U9C5_9ROSI|nr:hypothetical protein K2173_004628 [Erythroxylum novogranatense]
MDITEETILHHVGIVLFLLWILSLYDRCHFFVFFLSLIYLCLVHGRYVMKLRKKLQYQENRQANQKRVLSDSETVRWLNHAVEKIWPICMEQIASQKILLPIIPWFLEKYKPWTAKKVVVQHMYLGRNPPMFTEMRVLNQSTGDDHLVLELGMNFCAADDMSAILAVKLRRRLGFGMWAKLHMTGMHVEGKVLIGVKFLHEWPFLSRLRVCFVEPPYFQMTVKPIFTHGLDVTVLPGIAGWLDKLLSVAFEQTLVQPNMLVVDMEKFVSPQTESWFSVDEKEPVAFAKLEVVEASDIKPSDLNGLADPYVKVQLGPYKFRTKIQKRTLTPKWQEEFKIPICTWEPSNNLTIEVRDKDRFIDDSLGDCTVNINGLRDGERHDMWLPLQNIKMGRLHLAITILEANAKGNGDSSDGEKMNKEVQRDSFASDTGGDSFSSISSEKLAKVRDNFEPINVEGQQETGIWVHQPGSEVSQTWEPRKGKNRLLDTKVQRVPNDSYGSTAASGPLNSDSGSGDENGEGKSSRNKFRRGLCKVGSVFHRNKNQDNTSSTGDTAQSPYVNIRALNQKTVGVQFIVEDGLSGETAMVLEEGTVLGSPGKVHVKDRAKNILKHVFSRKGSRTSQGDLDSSDDESTSSPKLEKMSAVPRTRSDVSDKTKHRISENDSSELNVQGPELTDDEQVMSSGEPRNLLIPSSSSLVAEASLKGNQKVE